MFQVKIIIIFDGATTGIADGESEIFIPITPDSKDFSDTEHSAYLYFYGNKGDGTISIMELMPDGTTWLKLVDESALINAKFPGNADEVYVGPINLKGGGQYKIDLFGATSPALKVHGKSFQFLE